MKRVRTEEFFSGETRFYIDLPLQRTTSYKVLKKKKVPVEQILKRSVIIFLQPLRINSDSNLTQLGAERSHFACCCYTPTALQTSSLL